MNRKLVIAFALLAALGLGAQTAQAVPFTSLAEVGLNIDGTVYDTGLGNWGLLPANVDISAFDDWSGTGTGLGSITVTVTGAGAHDVRWFLDIDIFGALNSACDETLSYGGGLAMNQSAEQDEPGYGSCTGYMGNIWPNFAGAGLDNTMYDGVGNGPDDMSLGLGWQFVLNAGETATVKFFSAAQAPGGGFYLVQSDPDGTSHYAYSTLNIGTGAPEPATLLLLGLGLAATARRLRRS